jgi:hypothetical protein
MSCDVTLSKDGDRRLFTVFDGCDATRCKYCVVGSSSLFVDADGASGPLLLTGGLLVRVQPEEPLFATSIDTRLTRAGRHRRHGRSRALRGDPRRPLTGRRTMGRAWA